MELHRNVKKVVVVLGVIQLGVILVLTSSRLYSTDYSPRDSHPQRDTPHPAYLRRNVSAYENTRVLSKSNNISSGPSSTSREWGREPRSKTQGGLQPSDNDELHVLAPRDESAITSKQLDNTTIAHGDNHEQRIKSHEVITSASVNISSRVPPETPAPRGVQPGTLAPGDVQPGTPIPGGVSPETPAPGGVQPRTPFPFVSLPSTTPLPIAGHTGAGLNIGWEFTQLDSRLKGSPHVHVSIPGDSSQNVGLEQLVQSSGSVPPGLSAAPAATPASLGSSQGPHSSGSTYPPTPNTELLRGYGHNAEHFPLLPGESPNNYGVTTVPIIVRNGVGSSPRPPLRVITTGTPRVLPADPHEAHLTMLGWRCIDEKNKPSNATILKSGLPLCSCVPTNLVGKLNPARWQEVSGKLTWQRVNMLADKLHLAPGGYWRPPDCLSRRKVALIIPCRDREIHLRTWLAYMHPILQRHNLEYRIFVVEQAWPEIHNKGAMMNVGYLEAKKSWDFDCLMFHDVDLLMEDDRNVYTCWDTPIHFGAYVDKLGYSVIYHIIFGGAVAMKPEVFEKVNGYSNNYFGWGGEDDDFSMRLLSKRIFFSRPAVDIARYTSLKHPNDSANPKNPRRAKAVKMQPEQYVLDGLNSTAYKVVAREEFPLYTWIHAALDISEAVDYTFRTAVDYTSEERYCLSGVLAMLPLSRISCKYACDSHPFCVAFIYAEKVDDDFRCYLKDKTPCPKMTSSPGFVMYTQISDNMTYTQRKHEYSEHPGTDCAGKDYASLYASLGQCARACDQDILCEGFTYSDVVTGQARCWLKDRCELSDRSRGNYMTYRHKGKYMGEGLDYGLKNVYTRRLSSDCPENDLSSHFTSLRRCTELCDEERECVAAVYSFTMSIPCWLKSICLPQPATDANVALFVKESWADRQT